MLGVLRHRLTIDSRILYRGKGLSGQPVGTCATRVGRDWYFSTGLAGEVRHLQRADREGQDHAGAVASGREVSLPRARDGLRNRAYGTREEGAPWSRARHQPPPVGRLSAPFACARGALFTAWSAPHRLACEGAKARKDERRLAEVQ